MDPRTTLTRMLQELRALIVRYRPAYFRWADLSCACGFSSYVIEKALQEREYQTELVMGEWNGSKHVWLEVGDLLLDVTLTQFGMGYLEVNVNPTSLCDQYVGIFRGEEAHEHLEDWDEQSPQWYPDEVGAILQEFRSFSL